MTSIRVEVTAALIDDLDPKYSWSEPVALALEELTSQQVTVDGGDPDGGYIATIGQDEWTLVVDLPEAVNAFLDTRWEDRGPGEPFTFEIEIPTWVSDLVRIAGEAES